MSRAEQALERACDRCIAEAQAKVTLANGLELQFCQHHMRIYQDALSAPLVKS